MQEKFDYVRKAFTKLGDALLGMSPRPMTRPPNRGVNSVIYQVPQEPGSEVSPENLLTYADPVKLEHQVEEKPAQ